MGFQCCPQIMGLQRQGHVTKSNKRGAGKFICAEMGADRISSSEIIRHEDSKQNTTHIQIILMAKTFPAVSNSGTISRNREILLKLSVQTKERVRKL